MHKMEKNINRTTIETISTIFALSLVMAIVFFIATRILADAFVAQQRDINLSQLIITTLFIFLVVLLAALATFYRLFQSANARSFKANTEIERQILNIVETELEPRVIFRDTKEEVQKSVASVMRTFLESNLAGETISFYGSGSLQPSTEELEEIEFKERGINGASLYSDSFAHFLNPDRSSGRINRYVRLFVDDHKTPRRRELLLAYYDWCLRQADLLDKYPQRYHFTDIKRAPEFGAPISYILSTGNFFILFGSALSALEIKGENVASRSANAINKYFTSQPGDALGTPMDANQLRRHAEKFLVVNKLVDE